MTLLALSVQSGLLLWIAAPFAIAAAWCFAIEGTKMRNRRRAQRRRRRALANTPVATRSDRVQADLYPLPPLEARATTQKPPRRAA
jgi:hypothetical protein